MNCWNGPAFGGVAKGELLRLSCVLAALAFASHAFGQPTAGPRGTCDPLDANCDATVDVADADAMVSLLLGEQPCSACAGDMNEDGAADGADLQLFIDGIINSEPTGACCDGLGGCTETTEATCAGTWLGEGSTCAGGVCAIGSLTVYRPRNGNGYFPFDRLAVNDADKTDPVLGPGIRLNAPGNVDPAGEDDLIELEVNVSPAGSPVVLRRGNAAMHAWLTPDKQAGTELPFDASDMTGPLPIDTGQSMLTVFVEWASTSHGIADLQLERVDGSILDVVTFHTFHDIVMALGGEGQTPTVPVDPGQGTFVLGRALYALGYDVHLYDEDNVGSDGSGSVFDEVVDAVSHRGVDRVAIYGYSHGGGSTYDLADRLDAQRAGIGNFEIEFTSYVDAVGNNSDIDVSQETRRPPSSGLHANHYQHGTLFEDFLLDGGPVTDSVPPPTGLDVETTPWGANATHFEIDDFVQVRDFIEMSLVGAMLP